MMKDSYRFSLHFEGPQLQEHLIEADQLASVLYGLNSSLKFIAEKVAPTSQSTLQVRAELKQGSVISDLVFTVVATTPLLGSEIFSNAKDFIDFFVSLVNLKKEFGEKLPEKVVNYTFNGCNIGNVTQEIYISKELNKSIRKFCAPLKEKKADSLTLQSESKDILLEIKQGQVESVEKEIAENKEGDEVNQELWVYVDAPRLQSNSAWDFKSQEITSFKAKMLDEDFLSKVRSREILFGKDDQMKVKLEISKNNGKLSLSVTKVLDYKKAETNLFLDI